MFDHMRVCAFAAIATAVVLIPTGCDLIPVAEETHDPGYVQGTVLDATTGEGIESATVTVGAQTTFTSSLGGYSINDVPSKTAVTALASADGYVSLSTTINIDERETRDLDFQLVPETGVDISRIVLTWGANPRDLDSHVWAPMSEGTAYYHISYMNHGTTDGLPYMKLDLDDTNGYGPETVTIAPNYDVWHPGVYSYVVHEFAGDGILTGSDATVRVYISDELVDTIHVPTVGVCGENYYWYVGDLAIDSGTWTRVLTMSATAPFAYMAEGK
jgi:hypothetical protein